MAHVSAPKAFVSTLADYGYDHATGVPCSLLNGLFRELEAPGSPLKYTLAPREDTALGVASGLAVAGRKPIVLMQNSGLGYSLNVLTSFNLIYRVGLPLVISWRGVEDDAVEHDVIGAKLPQLLDLFEIPWDAFDADQPTESAARLDALTSRGSRTGALVVKERV